MDKRPCTLRPRMKRGRERIKNAVCYFSSAGRLVRPPALGGFAVVMVLLSSPSSTRLYCLYRRYSAPGGTVMCAMCHRHLAPQAAPWLYRSHFGASSGAVKASRHYPRLYDVFTGAMGPHVVRRCLRRDYDASAGTMIPPSALSYQFRHYNTSPETVVSPPAL